MSIRMLLVVCLPSTRCTLRTLSPRHRRFACGTGIETSSRRLTATPGRFSGACCPDRFSFQRRSPMSHNASACIAEVLPELLGPIKTTGLPSSISTEPKRLKLRIVRLVSMGPGRRREMACRLPQTMASSQRGSNPRLLPLASIRESGGTEGTADSAAERGRPTGAVPDTNSARRRSDPQPNSSQIPFSERASMPRPSGNLSRPGYTTSLLAG